MAASPDAMDGISPFCEYAPPFRSESLAECDPLPYSSLTKIDLAPAVALDCNHSTRAQLLSATTCKSRYGLPVQFRDAAQYLLSSGRPQILSSRKSRPLA